MEFTEFLVNDVSEEYFIINRMCCPRCKAPKFKVIHQERLILREVPKVLKDLGASSEADRLIVECCKCGFKLTLLFHLHKSYVSKQDTHRTTYYVKSYRVSPISTKVYGVTASSASIKVRIIVWLMKIGLVLLLMWIALEICRQAIQH